MKPAQFPSSRRRAAHGLGWLGALALAGCAVGPNYHAPVTKAPENWVGVQGQPDAAQTSLVVPSPVTSVDWWTSLHDDELNTLIHRAADENLTVLEAQALIQQARANVDVVGAGLFPTLNGSGSYSRGSFGGAPQTNTFQTGLNGVWNVDVFGGVRRQIEAADAQVEAAVEDRRNSLVTILAQIGTLYTNLRTSQALLQIARTNLEAEESTLKVTQQRRTGGFAAGLDVANAESVADNTRAEIPSLETQIRQDIYQLSVLLGQDPEALLAELQTPAPVPKTPDQIPIGLPSDLLRRRTDIRAAEAQLHAATANIGVAISALFPQFSLTSSLGFQTDQFSQLLKWANSSWQVGPQVTWQILAAGRIVGNIRLQEATQIQSYYAYKNTVLTAFQQVESAIIALSNEQIRRKSLSDSVNANQRAMDLANQLYAGGNTEFINVLTAEVSLLSSQQALAQSNENVTNDLIALYLALGGGWSEFPEKDAVPVEYPAFPYATVGKYHYEPHPH